MKVLKEKYYLIKKRWKNFIKNKHLNEWLWLIAPVFFLLYSLNAKSEILFLFSLLVIIVFTNSILLLLIDVVCKRRCNHIDNYCILEFCANPKRGICFCWDSNFFVVYSLRKIWIRKVNPIIEKILLWFIYNIYLRIDIIYNVIACIYEKDSHNDKYMDFWIDFEVLCFSILGIIFYYNVNSNSLFETAVCSFFIWRILIILFIKLNEIFSFQFKGAKYGSFNRSIIMFLINLTEIIIGYSFLYSSYYFYVFREERNFETIFKTLNIFTDWTVDGISKFCLSQQFLVLSQIFIFIILITVFIQAISNFDFQRKK